MSGSPHVLYYHISALWRVSHTSQVFNQQTRLVMALHCTSHCPFLQPFILGVLLHPPTHTFTTPPKSSPSSCGRSRTAHPLLDWAIIRLPFIPVQSGNGPSRAHLDLNLSDPLQSKLKIRMFPFVTSPLFIQSAAALSSLFCVLLRQCGCN